MDNQQNLELVPIVGYEPYYSINKNGQVYSTRTNKYLKPKCMNGCYWCYKFVVHSDITYPTRARLLATAFIPNPNNYHYIIHINGDVEDDSLSNLKWDKIPTPPTRHVKDEFTLYDTKGKIVYQCVGYCAFLRLSKMPSSTFISALRGHPFQRGKFKGFKLVRRNIL